MSGSNAGAIILFGVGVLLLNLAYSGRGAAVWAALRTGAAPVAETEATADSDQDGSGGYTIDEKKQAAGHGSAWRTVRIN